MIIKLTSMLALFCVLCIGPIPGALAAVTDISTDMSVLLDEETVYVGKDNAVFVTTDSEPVTEPGVRSVVYANTQLLLYTLPDDENQDQYPGSGILYSINPNAGDTGSGVMVARVLGQPCYVESDGLVYYVPEGDGKTLNRFSPIDGKTKTIATANAAIVELRASVDGLLVSLDDGSTMLYAPAQKELQPAEEPTADVDIGLHGSFETLLSYNGSLSVRTKGTKLADATAIDQNVAAATAMNGIVYYLRNDTDKARLIQYVSGQSSTLSEFPASSMYPILVSSGGYVYMIGNDLAIYRLDVGTSLTLTYSDLENVTLPVLVATPEMLLVYDEGGGEGYNRFVGLIPALDYEQQIPAGSEVTPLPEVTPVPKQATLAPAKTPAPTPAPVTLSRGSRGDDVIALQNILIRHGYLSGKADGIYGSGTVTAVKYLQCDMGYSQTGKVTQDFLNHLKGANVLPSYQKYVKLRSGDNGIRVYNMQTRLAKLGFLLAKPNGEYGPKTADAVKAFQKLNGIKQTGIADISTLKAMFGSHAKAKPTPKPTAKPTHKPNNTGSGGQAIQNADINAMVWWFNNERFPGNHFTKKECVYKLQRRLVKLGLLKKSQITKVYDENTYLAMRSLQADDENPAAMTGLPDDTTLWALFPY